jgi:hypothetical protein
MKPRRDQDRTKRPANRIPLRLPEQLEEIATDKPAVEDLPQGKDAAAEAAKAKDD